MKEPRLTFGERKLWTSKNKEKGVLAGEAVAQPEREETLTLTTDAQRVQTLEGLKGETLQAEIKA